jgi:hypothetical protein
MGVMCSKLGGPRSSFQDMPSKCGITTLLHAKGTIPRPVKQPYDALLVLDVEATCLPGTDFNWPNEIIVRFVPTPTHSSSVHFLQEWPVCVMRWKDRSSENGKASHLEVVDEFRSFARPIRRPQLSTFCMGLTGITQVGCLTFRRECSFHHQSM